MTNPLVAYDEKHLEKSEKKNYYDTEDIKYIYEYEIKKLLSDCPKIYYRMVYSFLYETGVRIGEARNVKFIDIDFNKNHVKISTLKQRSKIKYRVLYISDTTKALLLQHRVENMLSDTDFIFAKKPGRNAVTRKPISNRMKIDFEVLLGEHRVEYGHPHVLRHSRAIHLLNHGMDLAMLKKFLGHSSIQNTLIYAKYSNKDLIDKIKEIDSK
jgi:integrase